MGKADREPRRAAAESALISSCDRKNPHLKLRTTVSKEPVVALELEPEYRGLGWCSKFLWRLHESVLSMPV